ncbi:hypothetical protein Aph01nite_81090 [Acrocarpospora phusangensis]|uniref:Uncharacterized protein n=1 Tax=Acrocarpospora phusangensis TaxID=1070424 RepID=A0A919QKG0_9ACTN|nr:hypothetical protein Aph01nite_81090 [Acrocarpospora phusangensis]
MAKHTTIAAELDALNETHGHRWRIALSLVPGTERLTASQRSPTGGRFLPASTTGRTQRELRARMDRIDGLA